MVATKLGTLAFPKMLTQIRDCFFRVSGLLGLNKALPTSRGRVDPWNLLVVYVPCRREKRASMTKNHRREQEIEAHCKDSVQGSQGSPIYLQIHVFWKTTAEITQATLGIALIRRLPLLYKAYVAMQGFLRQHLGCATGLVHMGPYRGTHWPAW